MKCPYCDSEIASDAVICPHCMAEVKRNVKVIKINTNDVNVNQVNVNPVPKEEKVKKNYLKYFIIMFILIVILIFLLVMIKLKLTPDKVVDNKPVEDVETEVVEKEMTLNKGVFSGKENPVNFGELTIASIEDDENNLKLVDVSITRYLSDEEVNEIVSSKNLTLNPGFVFAGVEYNVYFHDFAYLGNRSISPVLNASILDSQFFNDFFLVDGHYYKSEAVSSYLGSNIKNEESATIKLVYQVPANQKYTICFGAKNANLGCFDG